MIVRRQRCLSLMVVESRQHSNLARRLFWARKRTRSESPLDTPSANRVSPLTNPVSQRVLTIVEGVVGERRTVPLRPRDHIQPLDWDSLRRREPVA